MKKIAFVANTTWYIHNFKTTLLKHLEEQGHEIYVIAPLDDYIGYLNELRNTHHIPLYHLNRKSINPWQEFKLFLELYRIYKRKDFDVILHFTVKPNLYGSFAAFLARQKSIMVIPGLGYLFLKKGWIRSLMLVVYTIAAKFNKKIIFENSSDLEEFVEEKVFPAEKGFALKGVGVDTEHFLPMEKKRKDNRLIFTFLGRLIYDKGVREYYEAAQILTKKYPNTEFWMLGNIDKHNPNALNADELVTWIESKMIHHWGHSADVREYIKESDCIVLPSYYREGVPKVLQEGMSMEKPIITTQMPGCEEAVDEGQNGYLIAPKSVESLVTAMEKIILLSPEQRSEMGKNGRKKAIAEFDHMISNHIYEKLILETL